MCQLQFYICLLSSVRFVFRTKKKKEKKNYAKIEWLHFYSLTNIKFCALYEFPFIYYYYKYKWFVSYSSLFIYFDGLLNIQYYGVFFFFTFPLKWCLFQCQVNDDESKYNIKKNIQVFYIFVWFGFTVPNGILKSISCEKRVIILNFLRHSFSPNIAFVLFSVHFFILMVTKKVNEKEKEEEEEREKEKVNRIQTK